MLFCSLSQIGLITVMFNDFGDFYPVLVYILAKVGLQRHDNSEVIRQCFSYGIHTGIPFHGNIVELSPHSQFINFICLTRGKFLRMFTKYSDEFKNIKRRHAEAVFVGSVIHSLDHYNMSRFIPDFMMLNTKSTDFSSMQDTTRIVRSCFVDDLPFVGLLFRHKMKRSSIAFYREFHAFARQIDSELANEMDVCIVV